MIEYEITAEHANGNTFESKTKIKEIKDVLVRELKKLEYTVDVFKRAISLK